MSLPSERRRHAMPLRQSRISWRAAGRRLHGLRRDGAATMRDGYCQGDTVGGSTLAIGGHRPPRHGTPSGFCLGFELQISA